ncbi:zinc finger CCHC domain-containing protein 7-like [Copidosoma floridanum]|uniref:zinc finger CCHC domain-containing protein 7-like n=1 Tax=Copidosoma floridanum TaxID=29053 RepID=UPI0006C9B7BD|nr:zinc finger CCHC domain-containing protein 7-like [Copidosoma floridanum]
MHYTTDYAYLIITWMPTVSLKPLASDGSKKGKLQTNANHPPQHYVVIPPLSSSSQKKPLLVLRNAEYLGQINMEGAGALPVTCQLCNTMGHVALRCIKMSENPIACSICKGQDHTTNNCPIHKVVCQICNLAGHIALNCQQRQPPSNAQPRGTQCRNKGHVASDCKTCAYCLNRGHTILECKKHE